MRVKMVRKIDNSMRQSVALVIILLLTVGITSVSAEGNRLKIKTTKSPDGGDCTDGAKNGDKLSVHYTGKFEDGRIFDSSENKQPIGITLGAGQVIRGWEKGLLGMCIGEQRHLSIPPDMAYGKQGLPGMENTENMWLYFDVELVDLTSNNKPLTKALLDPNFLFQQIQFWIVPITAVYIIYYIYQRYQCEQDEKKQAKKSSKQRMKTKRK